MDNRANIAPPRNFTLPTRADSSQPFPHIAYYGAGYDVLATDPVDYARPSLEGGGIRQPPVQITLDQEAQVGTTTYLFPADSVVTPTFGGTTQLNLQQIFRESDYASTFAATATISAGLPGIFGFSASTSFKQAFESSSSFASTSLYVTREVRVVQVQLSSGATMSVSDPFAKAVAGLSTSGVDSTYDGLIASFGTHYTTGVELGGRAYQLTTIVATTMSQMVSQEIDVTAGASGAFEGFTASASGSFDQTNTQKYQEATKSSSSIANYSGGTNTNSLDAWAPTVIAGPAPIAVALSPLTALLTSTNFPDDAEIATKQSLLDQAITAHLQQGAKASSQDQLQSFGTQFALVDSNGRFATRQDENDDHPLILGSSSGDAATFRYNNTAVSPLVPNAPMALTDSSFSGHMGIYQEQSFAMARDNTQLGTRFVSVFDNPANPGAARSGLPTDVRIGDQVYVISTGQDGSPAGLAMRSPGSVGSQLPAVAPLIGDPTLVWTIVAAG
jgi:hypothetical protein